ncbi:MAG: glycosyltransferase [candidate division WOR-3 bacterium]
MPKNNFDWVFFGSIPYDHLLRGRPGALIDELKRRGFHVYYLELPSPSLFHYFREEMTRRRSFFRFLFPSVQNFPGLTVLYQPPIFPASRYETETIRRFNRWRYARRITKVLKPLLAKRGLPTIAFIITPWWYEILERLCEDLNFNLTIYDCIDDLRVLCSEKQLPYFLKLQKKLVARADLTLISAQRLRSDIIKLYPDARIEFLPNGVDFDFFFQNGKNAPPPLDLAKIPRPIVGFVGALFFWIDTKLIFAAAQAFPHASFVLIGPVKGLDIPQRENIYFLGPRPYSQIPAYINNFDCCLIPFISHPLSERVDPIKVYEYLSLGKPVIACNLPELARMKELVYLAKDKRSFVELIGQALNEKDENLKAKRIEYAKKNSWEVRVSQLLSIVEKELE